MKAQTRGPLEHWISSCVLGNLGSFLVSQGKPNKEIDTSFNKNKEGFKIYFIMCFFNLISIFLEKTH